MYTAKDATAKWNMSPEQIEHFNTLTNQHDMSDYLREIAVEKNLVQHLQGASPDILVDVPQAAPAAGSEIKTVKIDGKVVEGTQEFIDNAMKIAFAHEQSSTAARDAFPARDRNGRYTAEPAKDANLSDVEAQKAADRATLDLAWKRGELTTEQFLEKSGALDSYLASRGLDLNAQQQVARTNAEEVQSWAAATEQFKAANPDWPGGEQLMARMVEKLEYLHLTGNPSVESLERCQAAIALEDQMGTCTDSRKMAELQELYRIHVEGRTGQPDYRR